MTDLKYTLVRHSGFDTDHHEFAWAVEPAALRGNRMEIEILAANGFIGTYTEAEDKAEDENYPATTKGLIPHVRGDFSTTIKLDGRPLYIVPPPLIRFDDEGNVFCPNPDCGKSGNLFYVQTVTESYAIWGAHEHGDTVYLSCKNTNVESSGDSFGECSDCGHRFDTGDMEINS